MTIASTRLFSFKGDELYNCVIPVNSPSVTRISFPFVQKGKVISLESDYYKPEIVQELLNAVASGSAGSHKDADDFDAWMKEFLSE